MNTTFDPLFQPYASNRYCVTAKNGMVCTGSNLASAAGLEVLRKGGNAVDAAIATAAALTVVEPTANGLGSDAFAIVWMKDKQFTVEPRFSNAVMGQLLRKGHQVSIAPDATPFGRGQMIVRLDNGVLVGGCESRTDSNIACY